MSITPVSVGIAHVAVVAYGSDGIPATEVFNVNVNGWTAGLAPAPGTPIAVATPPNATLATPIAPLSQFTPTVEGSFPTSVLVGQRTRVQQTVTLTNPSLGVPAGEVVTLGLSRTGSVADYTLASSTTKSALKVGKPAKLILTADRFNSAVPAGSYHVVVTVTDPAGGKTTLDTGKTLNVVAPSTRLTAK